MATCDSTNTILRVSPLGDDRLNIQVGKFATVFGNWVPRHLSWDNPFINAPLPYEDILGMTDRSVPPTPAAFLNRKNIADKKADWIPLIWGPSYASGAAVSGRIDWFDYALEIKNASISSRPDAWDLSNGQSGSSHCHRPARRATSAGVVVRHIIQPRLLHASTMCHSIPIRPPGGSTQHSSIITGSSGAR